MSPSASPATAIDSSLKASSMSSDISQETKTCESTLTGPDSVTGMDESLGQKAECSENK